MTVSPRAIKRFADSYDRGEIVGRAPEQQRPWSCGPAALATAARLLGVQVDEDQLRRVAGTDPEDGTDEHGLVRAARAVGIGVVEFADESADNAWNDLVGALLDDRPVILCVDEWEHWVTAVEVGPDGVTLADPEDGTLLEVGRGDLLARWRGPPDEPRPFYGIILGDHAS